MSEQDFEVQRSASDFWFACVDICVIRDSSLSLTARAVYSIICSYASTGNRTCWPTVKTLAKDAGVSSITIQRALKELADRGVIVRRERFEGQRQISSKIFIVGFHAECYSEEEGVSPVKGEGITHEGAGVSPVIYRTIPMNDIKDSLTGEAKLPNPTEQKISPENPQPSSLNPKEVCTPDDAPDILKQTAEYLLFKTGRKGLTWDEISDSRTLSANHTPARIQKEIDTACDRFRRKGRALWTLTFGYILGALQNQQSRGKRKGKNTKPDTTMTGITQADIDSREKDLTPEEIERIEADLREGRLL